MHPTLVRRIVSPLLHGRRGRRAAAALTLLERTQWWPPEELAGWQWARLQALLRHAATNVPYYRRLFGRLGLRPEDLRDPADLRHLPVLEKDVVRDRCVELIAAGARKVSARKTSGSTGIPLRAVFDGRYEEWLRAAERRRMRWWGQDLGTRTAYFMARAAPRFNRWKRQWLLNDALVNSADLSPAGLERIYGHLVRFRAEALRGKPNTMVELAQYVLTAHTGQAALRPQVVWSTAEILYPDQRAVLMQAFRCPVVNEYGSNENGLIAVECPAGRLHVVAENIFLEFRPIPRAEGLSEILVTNLHNYAMPFIRYALGDLGRPLAEACLCGRALPPLALTGARTGDLVVLPDGRIVDSIALVVVMDRLPHPVRQFLIVQEEPARFTVLLVADDPVGMAEAVARNFTQVLGFRPQVDVRIVDRIPPEPGGKLRRFVSRLDHPTVRHREDAPAPA